MFVVRVTIKGVTTHTQTRRVPYLVFLTLRTKYSPAFCPVHYSDRQVSLRIDVLTTDLGYRFSPVFCMVLKYFLSVCVRPVS